MTRVEQRYRRALNSIDVAASAIRAVKDTLPACDERDELRAAFDHLLSAHSRVMDAISFGKRYAAID